MPPGVVRTISAEPGFTCSRPASHFGALMAVGTHEAGSERGVYIGRTLTGGARYWDAATDDARLTPDLAAWAQELKEIRAIGCIDQVTPRPIMIVHGSIDDVVPLSDARALAERGVESRPRMSSLPHDGRFPVAKSIGARSLAIPLDVRAATFSPSMLASALSSSSAMPSPKYSCSGSPLMLTKGSTAIES